MSLTNNTLAPRTALAIATLACGLACGLGSATARAVEAGSNEEADLRLAHHDETMRPSMANSVDNLVDLAFRTCFGHGDDVDALRQQAHILGWRPVDNADLKRNETAMSHMLGGWLFSNVFGRFSVMQSRLKEDPHISVCSITTKLSEPGIHQKIKESFLGRFRTAIAEESDTPAEHIDRFWLAREGKPPVKASMIFVRSNKALTIRMIHGHARPAGA